MKLMRSRILTLQEVICMYYRMFKLPLLISLTLLVFSFPAFSAVIRVRTDGNDLSNGSTWALAKKTIADALSASVSGNEIWVKAGTYTERITLKSGVGVYGGFAGTETSRTQRNWKTNVTIIDGNKAGSVVTSPRGATTTTRIDGFTIRNGTGTEDNADPWHEDGGGIYCVGSSPTIANNTITACDVYGDGAGIYCCDGSSPFITSNTISGCKCSIGVGGGIYCINHSCPTITGNTIAGNRGNGEGGGIYCYDYSSPAVTGNTITNNSAGKGAGIYCFMYSSPVISGNTFTRNRSYGTTDGGFWENDAEGSAVFCGWNSNAVIRNNTITANGGLNSGSVILCEYSSITLIEGNTISGNSGCGISVDGSSASLLNPLRIVNNIVSNNDNSGCSGLTGGIACAGTYEWGVFDAVLISNNIVTGNKGCCGAGINCGSFLTISNNLIADNMAKFEEGLASSGSGGGIHANGFALIENNLIVNNTAERHGGGIYLGLFVIPSPCQDRVLNNTIVGNTAQGEGGAIYSWESGCPKIWNNIIAFCSSGVYVHGASTAELWRNCTYGNTGYNYSGTAPGEEDILADPRLVDKGHGNYHIKPTSPCKNAGDDRAVREGDRDMDLRRRIEGSHVDIGADEYRKVRCDLDGNGSDDLVGLAANSSILYSTDKTGWRQVTGILAKLAVGDFNGDGRDDLAGLNARGEAFLTTNKTDWTKLPGNLTKLYAGDIDGDGKDDLVGLSPSKSIYYSTNKTGWVKISGSLNFVTTGDINKDGKDDIIGLNSKGEIYYSTNRSTWTKAKGILSKLAIGDVNGDGADDIIGLNSTGKVYYTLDKGAHWGSINGAFSKLASGDVNGDGVDDIIVLNSAGSIYYTTNKSAWTKITGTLTQMAIGDFDGDGEDDIAGLSSSGLIYYTTNKSSWVNIPGRLSSIYSAR